MEWFVKLKGLDTDIRKLFKFLNSPEICIIQRGHDFFLKSTDFDSLQESEYVLRKAKEIVSWINGVATIDTGKHKTLEVDDNVHGVDDNGNHLFSFRIPIPTIVGTGEVIGPAGSQQHSITEWLPIARNDEDVAKVLRLFSRPLDWVNLYRIYEVIESDAGGGIHKIVRKGWATNKEVKSFKHTANNPGATGDDARHGKQTTQPPPRPMSLSEARSLVKSIFQKWIEEKI